MKFSGLLFTVIVATASASLAKTQNDPGFVDQYQARIQCLGAFLDTAKQAGFKSAFSIGTSNSCYFCGGEAPVISTSLVWSHDGQQTLVEPFYRKSHGELTQQNLTIYNSSQSPATQNGYACFVDPKNHQIGRAFYSTSSGLVFDDDRVAPVLCGKNAKRAIIGQGTTSNTLVAQEATGAAADTQKQALLQALEAGAKSAMNSLTYEKLKDLAKNSTEIQFLAKLNDSSCKSVSPELAKLSEETQELGRKVADRVRLERAIDDQNRNASLDYNDKLARAQATGGKSPTHPAPRPYPPESIGLGAVPGQRPTGSSSSSSQ